MKACTACGLNFQGADWRCQACGYQPPSVDGFVALSPEFAGQGGGFEPKFFEQLAALEAQNFWFRARNRLIVWALRQHYPHINRFMEIGCGTGYVLAGVGMAYPGANLVGSEIFSAGLQYAASRVKTAELVQMDARSIPYVDEFDVIGAFDVLEHIVEDDQVLAAMLRAVCVGGGVAITVPQHPWLWSNADESACHVRRYRVNELREKVIRAGFNIEFESSFVSLLLPAMLVSRLAKRRPNAQDDPLAELKLPKWLNRMFEMVMALERRLIQIGLRFKFGGSILLIARKEK